jgi:hypothetical protein
MDAVSIVDNITSQQQEAVQNLIDNLSISSSLTATEYITVDDINVNMEMVTDDEIISLFFPEDEEDDDESSSTPAVVTKDAVSAFETAFNFLQQGDIEVNYDEFKVFRSLKRKVELYSIANQNKLEYIIF